MTIRPIDFNGMIQRTDDVGMLKKHEDSKPLHDQQNIQLHLDKREDELAHRVSDPVGAREAKNESDAKDEGRNKYFSQKKKADKKDEKSEGRVFKKNSECRIDIRL